VAVQYSYIAAAAAGVVLIIGAVIVGFVLYQRKLKAEQRKLLADYSAQLMTLTMQREGGALLPKGSAGSLGSFTEETMRANLVVPATQFVGADATLLNTVMEVALPGFLRLEYATDIHAESRLTAGGAGTIYRATLHEAGAIRRCGTEVCAVKHVCSSAYDAMIMFGTVTNTARLQVADWPSLSDEDNADRFHQEVSIMWSLCFHANIIKLVGYTDAPRTIVTRLYPTDLFRYLHAQDDKAPLESHLMLHLCSGMVGAVAAVHSMGIAHRDIKTPNFLLQEPRPGSPFPDPILCDFGLSRTRCVVLSGLVLCTSESMCTCVRANLCMCVYLYVCMYVCVYVCACVCLCVYVFVSVCMGLGRGSGEGEWITRRGPALKYWLGLGDDSEEGQSDSVKGFSPRYAPPEVFARIYLRHASNTVQDDKQADVYSMGVVIWETMTRQVLALTGTLHKATATTVWEALTALQCRYSGAVGWAKQPRH
jgi:serine/threonine protein kinase